MVKIFVEFKTEKEFLEGVNYLQKIKKSFSPCCSGTIETLIQNRKTAMYGLSKEKCYIVLSYIKDFHVYEVTSSITEEEKEQNYILSFKEFKNKNKKYQKIMNKLIIERL